MSESEFRESGFRESGFRESGLKAMEVGATEKKELLRIKVLIFFTYLYIFLSILVINIPLGGILSQQV